jgi:hypothetical protein
MRVRGTYMVAAELEPTGIELLAPPGWYVHKDGRFHEYSFSGAVFQPHAWILRSTAKLARLNPSMLEQRELPLFGYRPESPEGARLVGSFGNMVEWPAIREAVMLALHMPNEHDIEHARATWAALNEDPDNYDGPETIMLSIGYADVWLDGDVVAFGKVVANVS